MYLVSFKWYYNKLMLLIIGGESKGNLFFLMVFMNILNI